MGHCLWSQPHHEETGIGNGKMGHCDQEWDREWEQVHNVACGANHTIRTRNKNGNVSGSGSGNRNGNGNGNERVGMHRNGRGEWEWESMEWTGMEEGDGWEWERPPLSL